MKINYLLRKLFLTNKKDEYVGYVIPNSTIDQEELIRKAVKRNPALNEDIVRMAVHAYDDQTFEELRNGNNIVTPMCNIKLSISGVFDLHHQEFDPDLHQVKLNYTPGKQFKELPKKVEMKKLPSHEVSPEIKLFIDSKSKTENSTITPGEGATLRGNRLKVNMDLLEEGIFFVAENQEEFRVETILRNMPSEAIFTIPSSLLAGKYSLEVRSKMESKTLKIGVLEHELVVN